MSSRLRFYNKIVAFLGTAKLPLDCKGSSPDSQSNSYKNSSVAAFFASRRAEAARLSPRPRPPPAPPATGAAATTGEGGGGISRLAAAVAAAELSGD